MPRLFTCCQLPNHTTTVALVVCSDMGLKWPSGQLRHLSQLSFPSRGRLGNAVTMSRVGDWRAVSLGCCMMWVNRSRMCPLRTKTGQSHGTRIRSHFMTGHTVTKSTVTLSGGATSDTKDMSNSRCWRWIELFRLRLGSFCPSLARPSWKRCWKLSQEPASISL